MLVSLIQVPYDSGHRDARMGRGPAHFLGHGAAERLREAGQDVHLAVVEAESAFRTETKTAFELHGLLAAQVRAARTEHRLPLVLAGNCNSAVGTVGGLAPPDVGVIWFDGHADFNTPETTTTGFLDGMGLATLTGRCWRTMAASVPGFRPLADENVILVGARDIGEAELEALERSGITWVGVDSVRSRGVEGALGPALAALRERVAEVYMHIDLDVHDPAEAPANHLAPPDGLTVQEVQEAVRLIARELGIAAAALASYDPAVDPEDRTLRAGLALLDLFAEEHGAGG
ncbi:MAG: arginase family protein [Alphaproteobacteria bacterium]|nr:arginase family protein [Alphaproteobacteria bacterium]